MEEIRLDAFCDSVRDGTHDTPKPVKEGCYLVTSKAIKNNTVYLDECYYISQEDYDKINKRSLVEKWDVLMTMIGSVGRLLLVKEQPNYAIKNIALFKLGDELKAKWLYYYLSNPSVQNYFESIASGTSQHFIGLGHLRRLKIDNLHSSSNKIVSILSAYDNLIENNNKRIRLLEQMAENLYKEWFVRFRFPGHEKAEFENGLPNGWRTETASNVVDVMSGGTPKTEREDFYGGDIPFYTPKDADDSIFVYSTITYITEEGLAHCNSQYYPVNTLMITARGTVGKLSLLAVPMAMNQSCFALKFKDNNHPYYLYYSIKNEVSKLKKMASGGVFDTIVVKTFDHIKITVPSEEMLFAFDKVVTPLLEQIQHLQRQSNLLSRQRDLLLPRLMSGKLEVKV